MATAVEPTSPTSTFTTEVDRQIDQATNRIRTHDAILGLLILGSFLTAYAVGMIILDKLYAFPASARQASFFGFVAVFAAVAYLVLIRPLRRRVNPLYAAMQVERTIEDSKNSVAGYVELRDRDLNPHVRNALGARAAHAVGEADLNRTVNHRSLLYLGSVFGLVLLALVVLLVLFRPSQFLSLLGRAFNPFSARAIVSQTQILILQPEGGNTTVTANQPVSLSVLLNGRVPAETAPDCVRALIRYSATDAVYEELPLERGANKHDWNVQIPSHLVQNGFWYKVAAGDGETAEYRVNVRTLPQFLGFETTYEYPAYLRMPPATVPENSSNPSPDLSGYRGTKVTLTARTNREVRDGQMQVLMPGLPPQSILGERLAGRPDSLRFALTLRETGTFKLAFTATNGERNLETRAYQIEIISDQPPMIEILDPKDESTTRPLNGRLAIDASIADDFGLAGASLRLQIKGPKPVPLAPKAYLEGKSLRREADGTFPSELAYKDSIEFAKLTTEGGPRAKLAEGTVIEYWLEATDNQEPKPNVGRSKVRIVTLGPPVEEKQAQQQKNQRDQQEQANRQAEQKRLDGEKRAQKPGPHQPAQKPQPGEPAAGVEPRAAEGADQPPKEGDQARDEPKEGPPNAQQPPQPGGPKPKGEQPQAAPKKNPADGAQGQEPGEPQPAPAGQPPSEEQVKKDAEKVQEALNKEKTTGGEAKPNDSPEPGQRAEGAAAKPMPMGQDQPQSEPKDGGAKPMPMGQDQPQSEPKDDGAKDPSAKGSEGSKAQNGAESKPKGNVQPPPPPVADKGDPKPNEKPSPEKGEGAPEAKPEPVGAPPGQDKESPDQAKPMNREPEEGGQPQEAAGQGKPSSGKAAASKDKPKPQGSEPTEPNGQPSGGEQDGSEGAAKPQPQKEPARGGDKPSQPSKEREPGKDGAAEPKTDAGSGKSETAPEPAGRKPAPPENKNGAAEPKPMEGQDADPEPKNEGGSASKPQPGQPPSENRGSSKPSEPGELAREAGRKSQQDSKAESKPNPKDGPEQLLRDKDKFKQTARDLNSKDENTRKQAEDRMDKAVGQDGRREAGESAKGLDSSSQQEQKKAEEDLDQLQKKKKKESDVRKDETEQKEKKDELAKKAKDLNSPDKNTREKAEQDLDKQVGEQGRKDLQESMKQAAGGDASKKDAADRKLDELAKKDAASKGPKGSSGEPSDKGAKPTPEQIAEMKKTMEDLASDDSRKREAAEKTLDQQIGKENREKAQDAMKDAKENPAEAQRKLEEMAKEAADKQVQKNGQGNKDEKKGLSPDEQKKLEDKLADLNSQDEQKRKDAEKSFDEKLGKEQREKLQEAVKDAKGKPPGTPQEGKEAMADAKKKLDEMAKNPGRRDRDPRGNKVPSGASNPEAMENTPAEADPKNLAKSAELQLERFKEKQFDRDFLKSLGKNEEEYRRFLEGYERMVQKLRDEAAQPERAAAPKPTSPTINVGGAGSVDARFGGDPSTGTTAGTVIAPRGFSDAKKKFGEEASKLKELQK